MIRPASALLLACVLAACSVSDDQRAFEDDALQPPSGYTRTGDNGEILSNDPDDWRTAPLFASTGFRVEDPPYPNPARVGDALNLTLYTLPSDAFSGGIEAVAFLGVPPNRLRYVLGVAEPPLAQFVGLRLETLRLPITSNQLVRVYLFDSGTGSLVSYGDLSLTP